MQDRPGVMLRFYVAEGARHGEVLLWEWVLQTAQRLGLPGGSAFRAIGGFGRRQVLHESRSVELAGHETIVIEFILTAEDAQRLRVKIAESGAVPMAVQWPVGICNFEMGANSVI